MAQNIDFEQISFNPFQINYSHSGNNNDPDNNFFNDADLVRLDTLVH